MSESFGVRTTVRGYEVDTTGHLTQAVYLQYGEHARWECLRAAGITQDRLIASGVGPVQLELTLRFLRELRSGDEVVVSCEFLWREGKTFQIRQEYVRADGTPAATLTGVCGLLDLERRQLVTDPRGRLHALALVPEVMNL